MTAVGPVVIKLGRRLAAAVGSAARVIPFLMRLAGPPRFLEKEYADAQSANAK